jgi:thiamine biosynthesis lipoprotein
MATRFELVIRDMDPIRARAAGEEAMAEIQRIEDQLSWFRPQSLLNRINREAAERPVKVHAPVFQLLETCKRLDGETGGAFDPTVIPGDDGLPTPGIIAPGMDAVELDARHRTVRFLAPGIALNLGAIGKGYALDEAAAVLREAGVSSALLHGGTSSAVAVGGDGPGGWRIGVSHPAPDRAGEVIAHIDLENAAFSASGIFGRGRSTDEGWIGHVIDPRTGTAVSHTELAAVVTYSSDGLSAARADALSTALLVLGQRGPDWPDEPSLCFSDNRISEMSGPWQPGAPPYLE